MSDSKINLDNENAEILSKMDEMQEKFKQINRVLRRMRVIAMCGAIVILILLAIFAGNFASFVRDYDKKALTYELKDRVLTLASSNEVKQLLNSVQDKLLSAYGTALIKEFKKSTPLFVKDIQNVKEDVTAHLESQVKHKLVNNLIEKLADTEVHVLAEYFSNDVSQEKLTNILDYSRKKFIESLTDVLDKKIDPFIIQLNSLNDSFKMVFDNMEQSGEFKEITSDMLGEIENRLIENLLELVIYQINPEKGNKPVNQ